MNSAHSNKPLSVTIKGGRAGSKRQPDAWQRTPPSAELWLDALPAPVLGVDRKGRICFSNAAAGELLVASGRGVQDRRLRDVFGDDSPLIGLWRRALDAATAVGEADVALTGPGFALGRAHVTASLVSDLGYVALVFMRSQRPVASPVASAVNSAARTLAHEVRNPLAGIRAAAQLMAREGDDETTALAALICDEVDRIQRLTKRIDPLSASEPLHLVRLNVHEPLDRVSKLIASSAPNVRLRQRYDPSLPAILGDRDQLIQAFLNIAKNAVEAIAAQTDGDVTLSTSYRSGVRYRASASASPRPQLEVQFIDNGPGVPSEIAERLFEPFTTTKAGGMGLGLTLAADIIARHGGRIELDSTPGRTVFSVLLPIEPE
jgi:two-component system nitrogen regulation sensor histidine kinase GlnL